MEERYLNSPRKHPVVLLTGSDAEKIKSVAFHLAQGLLCRKVPRDYHCSTCERVTKQIHPDCEVIEEKESSIKVETIRHLLQWFAPAPLEGKNKVAVILAADKLTTASANALLKALEEPGPGRYFILTTMSPQKLLPTVLSRVLRFPKEYRSSQQGSKKELASYLAWFEHPKENQEAILAAAENKEEAAMLLQAWQQSLRSRLNDAARWPETLRSYEESLKFEEKLQSAVNIPLQLGAHLLFS